MGDWSEGGNVGLGPYEFLAGEYRNKPIFIDAVNRIGVPVQINPRSASAATAPGCSAA